MDDTRKQKRQHCVHFVKRIKSHLLSCGSVHIHLFDVNILGSLKFFKQVASTIVTLLAATGLV